MIPVGFDVFVVAASVDLDHRLPSSRFRREAECLGQALGLNMDPYVDAFLRSEQLLDTVSHVEFHRRCHTISGPHRLLSVDLRKTEAAIPPRKISIPVACDRTLDAFAAYFTAHLVPGESISTSPWAAATCWDIVLHPLSEPSRMRCGAEIEVEYSYDGQPGLGLCLRHVP